MSERKAIFYVILSSLVWSTSFPSVKIGLNFFSPFVFILIRFLVGTFFYYLVFRALRLHFDKNIFKEKSIYIIGILTFLSYITQYLGQRLTLASRAALIINLFVIWTPVLAVIFLKEKFQKKYILSLILLIPGMFFLSAGRDLKDLTNSRLFLGDLIILIASFCWAFYIIISKNLLEKYNVHEVNIITFGITALLSFPILIFENTFLIVNWQSTLIALHLGIGCTVLAYYLYTTGLKNASAIKSTFFVSLEVLFSFVLSSIFLKERWVPIELLGGALMLIAVALAA